MGRPGLEDPPRKGEAVSVLENLSRSSRRDEEPLDAYSRKVGEVTEKLEPAVISVGTIGGGSGVILGTDRSSATASPTATSSGP